MKGIYCLNKIKRIKRRLKNTKNKSKCQLKMAKVQKNSQLKKKQKMFAVYRKSKKERVIYKLKKNILKIYNKNIED